MENNVEIENISPKPSPSGNTPQVVPNLDELQRNLGIVSVSEINRAVESGDIAQIVLTLDSLHTNEVNKIAETIGADNQRKKVLLIAGPSASGKTTFAKKLDMALQAHGVSPVTISLDNYFMNKGLAPKHYDGSENLEALEAIDYQLFNQNLADLIEGQKVEIPRYSFKTASRLPEGIKMQLADDQILVVEGIHALNPRLTSLVDEANKTKIYISPLNEIHKRGDTISPTDVRFLRRLVRDYKFRSSSADNTFRMWVSVIAGEKQYILPFMNTAHVIYNSSILYELCVLKKYAMPLLEEIESESPYYDKAHQLWEMLSYFTDMDDALVLPNSLLREFIGGSVFKY